MTETECPSTHHLALQLSHTQLCRLSSCSIKSSSRAAASESSCKPPGDAGWRLVTHKHSGRQHLCLLDCEAGRGHSARLAPGRYNTQHLVSAAPPVCRPRNDFNQTYQVHSSTASQLCGVAFPWQGSAGFVWVVLARPRLSLGRAAHAVCAAISATTKRTRGSFAMISGVEDFGAKQEDNSSAQCQHRLYQARHWQSLQSRSNYQTINF